MKRLHDKNQLIFSLLCIGFYIILFSSADNFSQVIGTDKIITAPIAVIFSAVLFLWLRKHCLLKNYGICSINGSCKTYLYFFPFIILAACNLWTGITMNFSVKETVLHMVSMLCVGFIEEIIFRGFLFKSLCKDNKKTAIIISSVTFGFGHIVNLMNGAELLPTILQIIYATAVGFAFTVIFYKSGSIIPCIITHSVVNATSVFSAEGSTAMDIISAIVITLTASLYGIYILHKTKKSEDM